MWPKVAHPNSEPAAAWGQVSEARRRAHLGNGSCPIKSLMRAILAVSH